MKQYTNSAELEFLKHFNINNSLINNLFLGLNNKELTVSIDSDGKRWDGEMIIKFNKKPTVTDVVNNYVSHCQADEIHMVGPKTLRLWWD